MAVEKEIKDDAMKELEYVSLISKVCSELETHGLYGDDVKLVAEFLTYIGHNCKTVDEFDTELKKHGEEFPDYFVKNLFAMIHAILHPKRKGEGIDFVGDCRVRVNQRGNEVFDKEKEGYFDKKREREGGNCCSRDRYELKGGYCDEPELYRVYKGRVSSVRDNGCFVELQGFKGKEGLVHVSEMANRRIVDAKEVVRRGQEVYVKVISVSGRKWSLSMKDVDQDSGMDLLPLSRRRSPDVAFLHVYDCNFKYLTGCLLPS